MNLTVAIDETRKEHVGPASFSWWLMVLWLPKIYRFLKLSKHTFLFTKRSFSKYGSGRPAQSYICRSVAGLGGSFWTAGTGAECGGAQGRAWVDQLAICQKH